MINVKNKALVVAIGNRIRDLRIQAHLSQGQLSHEADVPLSQIGRIERGETNPTISTLYVISKALKVELTDLIKVKL